MEIITATIVETYISSSKEVYSLVKLRMIYPKFCLYVVHFSIIILLLL